MMALAFLTAVGELDQQETKPSKRGLSKYCSWSEGVFLGDSSVVGVRNVIICLMSFSSARSESIEDGRESQIRNDNRNSADPA